MLLLSGQVSPNDVNKSFEETDSKLKDRSFIAASANDLNESSISHIESSIAWPFQLFLAWLFHWFQAPVWLSFEMSPAFCFHSCSHYSWFLLPWYAMGAIPRGLVLRNDILDCWSVNKRSRNPFVACGACDGVFQGGFECLLEFIARRPARVDVRRKMQK